MDSRNYFTLHIKHDYSEKGLNGLKHNKKLDNFINEKKQLTG